MTIDTQFTSFPVCPFCGEKDQDWWDGLPPKDDGDIWETCCGNCDKDYVVNMNVEVTFCTEKPSKEGPTPEAGDRSPAGEG